MAPTDTGKVNAADYLTSEDAKDLRIFASRDHSRKRHGLLPGGKTSKVTDEEHEKAINDFISHNRTWKQHIYIARSYEYWQLRAKYYPYIERSDSYDQFYLRGITCHPRLSEYPMCKKVIRDYFLCRDRNPLLQVLNMCSPLKEQISACINEVFVKNSERASKKFLAGREDFFEQQREKRVEKMMSQLTESIEQRTKLQD